MVSFEIILRWKGFGSRKVPVSRKAKKVPARNSPKAVLWFRFLQYPNIQKALPL